MESANPATQGYRIKKLFKRFRRFIGWKANRGTVRIRTKHRSKLLPTIKSMRRHGYSDIQIAKALGVTRQRIHQIVRRPKRTPNPAKAPAVAVCLSCKAPVGRRNSRCEVCAVRRQGKLRKLRYHTDERVRNVQKTATMRWRKNNPDKVAVIQSRATAKYLAKHRDEINAKNRQRYATDPVYRARVLEASKAWHRAHRAKEPS